MAKFLFVYRRGSNLANNMTPEEMQQHMQKWQKWIGKGLEEGWILDAGDALTQEGRVVNAKKIVTDGPFVESKEIVGGFFLLECRTKEEAVAIAAECPATEWATVEVREIGRCWEGDA